MINNIDARLAALEARLAAAPLAPSHEEMRERAERHWAEIARTAPPFDPRRPFPPTCGDESATHERMVARDKRTPRERAADERTGRNAQ